MKSKRFFGLMAYIPIFSGLSVTEFAVSATRDRVERAKIFHGYMWSQSSYHGTQPLDTVSTPWALMTPEDTMLHK